uniref:Retrovirus-related Pol polyprotein from transposon TNT 1-94 n=1 Tax=Tanacetum cinerariifolium TaxID=118510 RepID=A0A6L2JWX5_TANCI|nr:retrovirus-related Pol polyprotein from transposon TNT 1-94 [Tanacetum cinerariifolium]
MWDFQENYDNEADERTSEDYLKDLDIEFHERAMLANSKCFIIRKNIFYVQKVNEDTKCYKCGKKYYFARDCFSKMSQTSNKSPMSNSSSVLRVAETFDWDEEEVSNDEEETRVQLLMALADDELSMGKNHARNDNPFVRASLDYDHEMVLKSKDWVETLNLDSKLPNFNIRRILVPESEAVNKYL